MKHTRENSLKVLRALENDLFENYEKTGETLYADKMSGVLEAIEILTNDKYFNDLAKIYGLTK